MQLKTIFNHVVDYKPFVVDKVEMIGEMPSRIEITMRSRSNGQAICSGCGGRQPGYDRQPEPRRFEFVPLWNIAVTLIYVMRRVQCPNCGVKVESVPWSDGKSSLTVEMVLGRLGAPHELAGSLALFQRELGSRVQLSKTCGFMGIVASVA